jgi:hypothetical protein
MYVQTFKTPNKEPLSLLPLIEKHTKVTHIILASLHLHDVPGEIRLNDDRLESPVWDDLWHETWLLRQNGVKVMALLGGAAGGTYKRLNGTDAQVRNRMATNANGNLVVLISFMPTTILYLPLFGNTILTG